MRDPKRHVFTEDYMSNKEGYNTRKATKILLFIAKSVPGVDVGGAAEQTREEILVGCTRKYLYKIEGFNDTRDFYSNT